MNGLASPVVAIIFWLVVAGAAALGSWMALRGRRRDAADGVLAALELRGYPPLKLTQTELIEGYGSRSVRHPLHALTARVESGAAVTIRFEDLGRGLSELTSQPAPEALDDHATYLTIDGPDTFIVQQIAVKWNPGLAARSRAFADRVNQQSTAHGGEENDQGFL